jgi:UDP-2,3-diacylglucosamine pyrophosphatase LpxH
VSAIFNYEQKLTDAFDGAPVITVAETDKFVIISDVHRGTGDQNDNFAPNQNICFSALKHYYANGYTYIELGDGDELWENRRIEPIIAEHSHVFWLMNEFHKENRLIMLYGNHDIIKRKQ